MQDERYVPVRLAAEGLGRSVQTIYAWIRRDLVRHLKDERGGVWVFAPDLPLQHAERGRRGELARTPESA